MVDQGAVNVEEDHVEIVFRVPSRSTRTKTGRSPCFPRAGQASRLSHVVQRLSVRATTPGNCFPSRNSSDAPPPVEMCEILSATPAAFTAATESPPPTIDVAPAL